jgi:hypothetical protein
VFELTELDHLQRSAPALLARLDDRTDCVEVLRRNDRQPAAEQQVQGVDELRLLADAAALDHYAHGHQRPVRLRVHVGRDGQAGAPRGVFEGVFEDFVRDVALRRLRVEVDLQPARVVAVRAEDDVGHRKWPDRVDMVDEVGDRGHTRDLDQRRIQRRGCRVGPIPEQLLEHLEPLLSAGSEREVHSHSLASGPEGGDHTRQ